MSNMNVTKTRVTSGMVEYSCSISGTHRVSLVKHFAICHEESQDKLFSGLDHVWAMLYLQIHLNCLTKDIAEIVLRSDVKQH